MQRFSFTPSTKKSTKNVHYTRIYVGKYRPEELANGDTVLELLTRAKHLIAKSGNKWSPAQKERAEILFAKYPKLKELHSLLCQLRQVFADFPFFMYRL